MKKFTNSNSLGKNQWLYTKYQENDLKTRKMDERITSWTKKEDARKPAKKGIKKMME